MDYRSVVLRSRPVRYYPLVDQDTSLCRNLIPGADGTYPSAPTFVNRRLPTSATGRNPKFGSPSYADVGTWALTQPYVVEYWAVRNAASNGFIIAKDDSVTRGWVFGFLANGTSYYETGGTTRISNTGPVAAVGQLVHVVWAWEGGPTWWWVNGVASSGANVNPTGGVRPVNIGRRGITGDGVHFDGWIGHVAVYTHNLNALGVNFARDHYLAGLASIPSRRRLVA